MSGKPTTLAEFLDRAREALQPPLIYWLKYGGWQAGMPDQPGKGIDVLAELAALKQARPEVYAAYIDGLSQLGIRLEDLPDALPKIACDCTGYLTWALREPRKNNKMFNGWINTDAIYHDAMNDGALFVRAKKIKPGVLLVHPQPGGDSHAPGHVGIVTAVGPDGKASRMIHCAPQNFLIQPAGAGERTAIAETGTEVFDAVKTTIRVVWKAFASEVNA